MKDYSVVESDSMGELVDAVSELLNQGWDCQGGVCIVWDPLMRPKLGIQVGGGFFYAQALVRIL